MLGFVLAAGWPAWPLILCSVLSLAIILERSYRLRKSAVLPKDLIARIYQDSYASTLTIQYLQATSKNSPLGKLLYIALSTHQTSSLQACHSRVESAMRHLYNSYFTQNLSLLGTIASAAPLLGLLGTVIGIIDVFQVQNTAQATGHAALSVGIAVALHNTALGLMIAIPSLVFHRHFCAVIQKYTSQLEVYLEAFTEKFEKSAQNTPSR